MKEITRRSVLKVSASAAVAAQFAGRSIKPAAADPVKRFVMIWHANGAPSGGDTNFLDPIKDVSGGLSIKQVTYDGNGDHKSGMPFSTSAAFTFDNSNPAGKQSLDNAIFKASPKPGLRVTGKSKHQNNRGWVSFDDDGSPLLPIQNPRTAFTNIFGFDPGIGSGATLPTPGPDARLRTEHSPEIENAILSQIVRDAEELRGRLSLTEREKMQDQIAAIQKLSSGFEGPSSFQSLTYQNSSAATSGVGLVSGSQTSLSAFESSQCGNRDVLTSMFREPMPSEPGGASSGADGFSYEERLKKHMDLITTSFACDKVRAASLSLTPGGHDSMNYGFIGVGQNDPHNNIAHKIFDDPANMEKMRQVKRWEMQQVRYLLDQLDQTTDADGNRLLQNTLVLIVTECEHGNHGKNNVPVVAAGARDGILDDDHLKTLKNAASFMGASYS